MSQNQGRLIRRTFAGAVLTAALATLLTVQAPVPAALAAAPAVAEEAAPAPARTYIGPIEGAPRSARLGIVADDANFVAYVCSQDDVFNKSHSQWIKGPVADRKLKGEAGGVKIEGVLTDEKVEGSLTVEGKTLKFSAAAVAADSSAGLFRAEDKVDDEHFVFGWVIDTDGSMIGNQTNTTTGQARAQKGAPPGLTAPQGQANAKAPPVQGAPVTDPKKPLPQGEKGNKYPDAKRKEILSGVVQRLKAGGGSPLHGLVMHQIRRFLKGVKPGSPLEEKTFAQLRKAPRQALLAYVQAHDALPAEVRQATVGSVAEIPAEQPITPTNVKPILTGSGINPVPAPPPPPPSGKKIKSITAKSLNCIDEVDPETFLGFQLFDNIFVVYVVASGNTVGYSKKTAIYGGLKAGIIDGFSSADQTIFPSADEPNLVADQDVLVTAVLFEDHSGLINTIASVLKAVVDVATAVIDALTSSTAGADVAKAVDKLIDTVAAAFPTAQSLGGDTIIFKTDGRQLGLDGKAKTFFDVAKTTPGAGGPYHYRVQAINVQRQ
jgi:hypothetical protein